jgi:hypothetical protein
LIDAERNFNGNCPLAVMLEVMAPRMRGELNFQSGTPALIFVQVSVFVTLSRKHFHIQLSMLQM